MTDSAARIPESVLAAARQAESRGACNRGRASVAELADATGVTARDVLRGIAETAAEGAIRPVFGRPVPDVPAAGSLVLTDDDIAIVVLILEPPWQPLSDDRKRHLAGWLDSGDRLTLCSVTMMCGSFRVGHPADGGLSFTSAEIEQHLGMPEGAMR